MGRPPRSTLFPYTTLFGSIEARAFDGVRRYLKGVGDVERILARVALRSARPRDLTQLRSSLTAVPALRAALVALDAPLLEQLDRKSTRLNSSHSQISYAVL